MNMCLSINDTRLLSAVENNLAQKISVGGHEDTHCHEPCLGLPDMTIGETEGYTPSPDLSAASPNSLFSPKCSIRCVLPMLVNTPVPARGVAAALDTLPKEEYCCRMR